AAGGGTADLFERVDQRLRRALDVLCLNGFAHRLNVLHSANNATHRGPHRRSRPVSHGCAARHGSAAPSPRHRPEAVDLRLLTTLDPTTILASLGISQHRSVTPIAGGWDTSLWRVDDGRQMYALRAFRPEQAPVCRREALVMRALADLGLPVPRVHAENS